MYSVLRFITSDTSKLKKAVKIGEEINSLIPGKYDGLRKAGDGFACSASDNEDWTSHQTEIIEFLEKIGNPISVARSEGIDTVLDISVGSDIRTLMSSYRFSEALLRALVESGVALEISIYNVVRSTELAQEG